jgi:hypothetical protein
MSGCTTVLTHFLYETQWFMLTLFFIVATAESGQRYYYYYGKETQQNLPKMVCFYPSPFLLCNSLQEARRTVADEQYRKDGATA